MAVYCAPKLSDWWNRIDDDGNHDLEQACVEMKALMVNGPPLTRGLSWASLSDDSRSENLVRIMTACFPSGMRKLAHAPVHKKWGPVLPNELDI